MALYTDTDLKSIIVSDLNPGSDEELGIYPFNEEHLSAVGYDLGVGDHYFTSDRKELLELKEGESIKVPPKQSVHTTTLEHIYMPRSLKISGLIQSKVSASNKGLTHISTTIDPDWCQGQLLINLFNYSDNVIALEYGERFCTAIFLENKSVPERRCPRPANFVKTYMKDFKASTNKTRKRNKLSTFSAGTSLSLGSGALGYVLFKDFAVSIALASIGLQFSEFLSKQFDSWTRRG